MCCNHLKEVYSVQAVRKPAEIDLKHTEMQTECLMLCIWNSSPDRQRAALSVLNDGIYNQIQFNCVYVTFITKVEVVSHGHMRYVLLITNVSQAAS